MNNSTQLAFDGLGNYSHSIIHKPDCYSALAWRIYLTKRQNLILSVCYGSTILPTIMLNSMLWYALYSLGQWKKQSKFLIFVLTVSDTVMGLVSIPTTITLTSIYSYKRNCRLERLFMFFGQVNGHFSFYITLMIALQRYAKMRETSYGVSTFTRKILTKSGLRIIVWAVFSLSCAHGVVSTYFFGLVKSVVPNILMMILRGLILIVIQVCYCRVYIAVKKHLRTRVTPRDSECTTPSQRDEKKRPRRSRFSKVNRTVLIVIILLILSYLPATITDMWTGYYTLFLGITAPMLPRFLFYVSFTTIFMNCALNAGVIIYHDWSSLRRVFLV